MDSPTGLLSRSAYARLRGCTQQNISKLVAKGKIPLVDGKIDPVVADAALAANVDPAYEGRKDQQQSERPRVDTPRYVDTPQSRALLADRETSTELKKAQLERERLRLREEKSVLVERDAYNRALAQNLGSALQRLDTISARLGARLAAETDVRKCQDMIDEEVESIRQEIADNAQAMIDGAGRTRQ